ncbi:MAG: hypothetical protein C4321_09100, partial [Chloroflexota bacterium]
MQRLGRPALERALELDRDARPLMGGMAAFVLGQVGYNEPTPDGSRRYCREGVPTLLRLVADDPDADVRASAACA